MWAGDVTYIPMACGFLDLMAIIDWARRAVPAWRLSNTNLLNPRRGGVRTAPSRSESRMPSEFRAYEFDVRLGGSFAGRSFVAPFPRWRSSSRLRVRPGTGSAPGRASRYCGRGRRGPTRWRPSRRRAEKLTGSRAPASISATTGSGSCLLKRSGLDARRPDSLRAIGGDADAAAFSFPACSASPGAICGVDLASSIAVRLASRAIARVRRQLHQLLAQIGFDGVGHRRRSMLIALLRVEAVGDDHLRRRVDRRLRIVALDEAVLVFMMRLRDR